MSETPVHFPIQRLSLKSFVLHGGGDFVTDDSGFFRKAAVYLQHHPRRIHRQIHLHFH